MSAFTHGFNHGFFHGIFNRMFGGFGMFNWCGWNSAPIFYTPNYSLGDFYQYQTPMQPMPSVWNYNVPDVSVPNFNWDSQGYNYSANYVMPSFTANWGDTFQRSNLSVNNESSSKVVSDTTVSNYTIEAAELKQKWDKKKPGLSQEFFNKVVEISKRVKCSPEDLMAVMHSESVGTFSPKKWNEAGHRAVGLIQFTDIAAESLGTTLEAIEKMSALEQLDLVEKYLKYAKTNVAKFDNNHRLTAGELYSLVYLPAVSKKEFLAEKNNDPKGYYSQNKVFDKNKDEKIKKTEMAAQVVAHRA